MILYSIQLHHLEQTNCKLIIIWYQTDATVHIIMMSCPQTSRLCLIFTLAKASEGITGRNTNFYNNLAENEACEETLELENMSIIYYLIRIYNIEHYMLLMKQALSNLPKMIKIYVSNTIKVKQPIQKKKALRINQMILIFCKLYSSKTIFYSISLV